MAKEIKIVIERDGLKLVQHQQSFAGHLSAKGIIERARETEYLPRRLKKSSFIRIFDGGLLLQSGVWKDIFYPVAPSAQPDAALEAYLDWVETGAGSVPPFPAETVAMTANQPNQMASYLATISPENFKNAFDQLADFTAEYAAWLASPTTVTYPLPFDVYVYSDNFFYDIGDSLRPEEDEGYNTKWTADGLKLSAGELSETIFVGSDYRTFQLTGAGKNKITATNDFNADDVVLSPSGAMDIVMMPRLVCVQAIGVYRFNVLTDPVTGRNASGALFLPPVRARRYDKTHPDFIPAADATHYSTRWKRFEVSSDAAAYAGAYHRFELANPAGLSATPQLEPSSAFPVPPGDPYANTDTFPVLVQIGENVPADPIEPIIIALIKKDGAVYYVWSQ